MKCMMAISVKDMKPQKNLQFYELLEPIARYGRLHKWISCQPGGERFHIYVLRPDPGTPGTCVTYSDIACFKPEIFIGDL